MDDEAKSLRKVTRKMSMGKEIQEGREGNVDNITQRNMRYMVWKNAIMAPGCWGCWLKSNGDWEGGG